MMENSQGGGSNSYLSKVYTGMLVNTIGPVLISNCSCENI